MSQITTHILDTSSGKPAINIAVVLEFKNHDGWQLLGRGVSDQDGRVKTLLHHEIKPQPGIYHLIFDTRTYYFSLNIKTFYPSITIEFEITEDSHYHVPLLLNPFGFTTYRGS